MSVRGLPASLGSGFDDTLSGSANAPGTVEVFEGRAGNDTINGRGGFDRADYALDAAAVGGINVQLAAGTVTGDAATVGTDTLRSIESVRGSNNADTFDATGFGNGQPATLNIGSIGTFNEFNRHGGRRHHHRQRQYADYLYQRDRRGPCGPANRRHGGHRYRGRRRINRT